MLHDKNYLFKAAVSIVIVLVGVCVKQSQPFSSKHIK